MKFIYSGPASGVTLADGTEVLLWPNAEVELPETLDYTQTLLALNYLMPVVVDGPDDAVTDANSAVEAESEPTAEPDAVTESQPLKGKKNKEVISGS
ncbi:hypothetical protein ACAK56_003439 [Salmonella enterica]